MPRLGSGQLIRSRKASGISRMEGRHLWLRLPERTPKSAEVVVGMQHSLTRFAADTITPKKAADASLFCFTCWGGALQIAVRLTEFGCSRVIAHPWGAPESD